MQPRDNVRVTGALLLLVIAMAMTGVGTSLMLIDDKLVLCLVAAAMVFTVLSTVLLTCYVLELKSKRENARRHSMQCQPMDHETAMRVLSGNPRFNPGLRILTGPPMPINGPLSDPIREPRRAPRPAPLVAHAALPTPPPPTLPPIETLPQYTTANTDASPSDIVTASPPTYLDSNEYENNRIHNHSNAPPAYDTFHENPANNNFASFSPPPFYRPATPDFSAFRASQTASMFLSPEGQARSPGSERSVGDTSVTRVLSPLPASGKFRRSKARVHCTVAANLMNNSTTPNVTVTMERSVAGASSPGASSSSSSSRSDDEVTSNREIEEIHSEQQQIAAAPQMFIDCSKPEPTIFTINRDESII